MTSVNTNAAALTALRTLQQTNNAMDATQNRISTGYKIGEAKDNAAYWSISTTLKSDNKSLATVKDALGLGAATVDVAYEGLNSAKDVLDEISAKLTSARQEGIDRTKLQQEITDLKNQLSSIASGASFSGENWLSVDSSNNSTYSASKEVVASFSRAASGAITIGTIAVDISDVKLFDANANANGILDGQVDLKDASGAVLSFGGVSTGTAPAATALSGYTGGNGAAATNGTAATVELGTFSLTGIHRKDRIQFDLTVDSGVTRRITLNTDTITDQTSFLAELNGKISSTFGSAVATASVNAAGKIAITSASTGSASNLTVGTVSAVDGNGTVTGTAGISGAALQTYGSATAATASTAGGGTSFVATGGTWVSGDSLTVNFTYDNATYSVSLTDADTISASTNAGGIAALLQTKMDTAVGGAGTGTRITVTNNTTTNKFDFATVATGESKSIGIVSTTITGTNGSRFGIPATASSGTTSVGTAAAATYAAGTLNTAGVDAGDRIKFDLNVSGTAKTIEISTEGFTGTTATDAALFKSRVQAALDDAANGFGAGVVKVDLDGSNNITFSSVAKGASQYIMLDTVQGLDGDGKSTATFGLQANALTAGQPSNPATASSRISSAFTGPMTFDADDSWTFSINLNNGGAKTVKIDKASIIAAIPGSGGTINNIGNLVTVVSAAMTTAGVTGVTVSDNGAGSNKLKFDATTAGTGSLVISDGLAVSGSTKMSVSEIDLTSTSFKALTTSQQKDAIEAYIRVVDSAAKSVTAAAAKLGSAAKRIDLQKEFAQTLMDTIDKGVGNLVDADMSEESTKLQALQVKQQLGVQALSIANQSAQQLLRLFQ